MLSKVGALWRIVLLALFATGIWALTAYDYRRPAPLGVAAPAIQFSAARADATLARLLGPEIPHPTNSAESAAVRARIRAEFAVLGIKTTTYQAFACNPGIDPANIPCRTVNDVVAEVLPGRGKAVVLMAHYDSVPAGPGASDDEAGVAAIIETARALRARPGSVLHPVLALITDGEEAGLLGAKAFLDDPAMKDRVGAVVNLEARGSRGRSVLFQTSAGNGRLIDLYAHSVDFYTASSLFQEVYRFTPNDTDLTQFVQRNIPSFNFAFGDNSAVYHSPLDTRATLDRASLQAQGDNMLGVAASLAQTPFARLRGPDAVYLDLFGVALPRAPAAWVLPVAILAFVLLLFGAVVARDRAWRARDWAAAAALPPALLGLSVALGYGLHLVAQQVSGFGNPSHAHPAAFRVALAFGVVAATVLCARMARPKLAAMGVWLWFAGLGVAAAVLAPGLSPYFLLPVLPVALAALFRSPRAAPVAQAVGAVTGLVLWLGLAVTLETFETLAVHPAFMVPVALAVMTLAPMLDVPSLRRAVWMGAAGLALAAAIACAVVAGLQPAYSEAAPMRITLVYVEDATTGAASWAASTTAPLPPSLRRAAAFSRERTLDLPGRFERAYVAPAGPARLPPPTAAILSDAPTPSGRTLIIVLHGPPSTSAMFAIVPRAAKLAAVEVNGQPMAIKGGSTHDTTLACLSLDCAAEERLTLRLATHDAFTLRFSANRYGLPPQGMRLAAARPRNAMPSQDGDGVVQLSSLVVPAAR
jgi:hypothetical protein